MTAKCAAMTSLALLGLARGALGHAAMVHPTEVPTPTAVPTAAAVVHLFAASSLIDAAQLEFTRYGPGTAPPNTPINTCVVDGYTPPPLPPAPAPPPPPPPPPGCPTSSCPQRGKTTGHEFPRLSNCWGSDPYITNAQ